jgi:hypothetical protein
MGRRERALRQTPTQRARDPKSTSQSFSGDSFFGDFHFSNDLSKTAFITFSIRKQESSNPFFDRTLLCSLGQVHAWL